MTQTQAYETLKTDEKDGVLTVTVSRPKAMNALNTKFFQEMDSLVASLKGREDLRAVVITGEGKAFVAGADIAEMVDKDAAAGAQFGDTGKKTFASLEDLEVPVIAAVNGFCLGGGCELAMACDIRIASANAKFGQPEVNLGLTPGYDATQRLPRLVGSGHALYLLVSAEMISAEEALRIGLVQKVVAPEQLLPEATGLAAKIASKGPKAVRKVKAAVRKGLKEGYQAGSACETEVFGSLFGNEGREGMKAFLEKRKPSW